MQKRKPRVSKRLCSIEGTLKAEMSKIQRRLCVLQNSVSAPRIENTGLPLRAILYGSVVASIMGFVLGYTIGAAI